MRGGGARARLLSCQATSPVSRYLVQVYRTQPQELGGKHQKHTVFLLEFRLHLRFLFWSQKARKIADSHNPHNRLFL